MSDVMNDTRGRELNPRIRYVQAPLAGEYVLLRYAPRTFQPRYKDEVTR